MAKNIVPVAISALDLDQENARFENQVVSNQRDAIQHLLSIDYMAEKVAKLAEHISLYGDDPSELPLIIANPNKSKSYVVVEGNRRILAIKLLRNPALCPPGQKALQKKLNLILSKAKFPAPTKIQCSLLESRAAANLWIELKHTGENGGAGRVEWDGAARDAFREKQGATKTVGRFILDYIANDSDFDEELKSYAKSIKITNLTRLFGSSEAMNALGYRITGGKLELRHPIHVFRRGLEAVIFRFKEDDINVGDIYDSVARGRFFSERISPSDLPGSRKPTISPTEKNGPEDNVIQESKPQADEPVIEAPVGDDAGLDSSEQVDEGVKEAGGRRRSVPASNLRKRLINFTLKISQPRINNIYLELKNKIDVTETPNAGSVLFRVFLELSTDHALEKLKLNTKAGVGKDAKLRLKIETVVDKLLEKDILDKKAAADIKSFTSNAAFQSGTVDALHRFIHGPSHPVAKDINDIMDNWKPYFVAIWEYDVEFNGGSGQA